MNNHALRRTRPWVAFSFFIGLLLAMLPGAASATGATAVPWQGNGTDSIDVCALDEQPYLHWVLTPGGPFTISDATLDTTGGPYYPAAPLQAQVAHFYTPYLEGALEGTLDATAYARFTGKKAAPKPLLVISDGCYPGVTAEKSADTDWTREWTWDIEKDGDITEATFEPGDTTPRTVEYTVTVSATKEDTYVVSGSVVVTNHPMAPAPVEVTGVVDDVFGDLGCSGVLDPGESLTCPFSEEVPTADPGTNTATVTLSDGKTLTAKADWMFGATPDSELDECVTVVDDNATPGDTSDDTTLGTVCDSDLDENGEHTFPAYSATIDPADERFLPCCNEVDFENTAGFTTNDTKATGSDNHVVLVHVKCEKDFDGCTPGFWKGDRPANQPAWSYLSTHFGVTPSSQLFDTGLTLTQALDTEGEHSNLYFHGAAAYLNALLAQDDLIDYRYSVAQVEAIVEGTGIYAGLPMTERKDLLDFANNEGDCPFGARYP